MQEEEIAEVEMLLEAYFMHVDNTYNRLQTLNEYIQDTEDLVNLKLDQHRNQLIGVDLILTAFTSSVAIMTAVAGYFGMNLDSGLQQVPVLFNLVAIVTTGSCIAFFALFVLWLWHRRLLLF
jgi:magnesium transporter